MTSGGGTGSRLTPLTRNVLIALVVLYVLQIFGGGRFLALFALMPPELGQFRAWQLLTHYVVQGDAISTVLTWLMVFWFLPHVERLGGTTAVLRLFLITAVTADALALILGKTGIAVWLTPGIGSPALITAMIMTFALAQPDARMNFWFVLPMKAETLAWLTLILVGGGFLWSRSMTGALTLGGCAGGFIFVRSGMGSAFKRPYLLWKMRRLEKRLQRFEVIEGGGEGTARDQDGEDLPPNVIRPGAWGRNSDDDDPIVH